MKNESRDMKRDTGDYLASLFLDSATELYDYYRGRNPDLSSIGEILSLLKTYQESFERASDNMDSIKPLDTTAMCALHRTFQRGFNKTYSKDIYGQYHQLAEDFGKIRRELSDLAILPREKVRSLMDFCMTAQEVCGSYTQRIAYHPI